MRGRRITFWTILIIIILAVGGFYFYRSRTQNNNKTVNESQVSTKSNAKKAKVGKNNKILVVYFSRRKGVYNEPHLKTGNTEVVAKDIQAETKADIYQIRPVKAYPSGYNATTKVAQKEQDRNARPAIKGKLPNVTKYKTVFIGAPVWWGEYPMIVRTFLDKEPELNGKTLIPFATSEGSGLANFPETLKKQFPKAKVRQGFFVEGTSAHSSGTRTKVNNWLNRLGY